MAYAWIIWLIVAAILIGAEVFTAGFFILWFGIGALVASLLALAGVDSVIIQVLVFLGVSIALVFSSRKIFERFFRRESGPEKLKSGIETIVGQIGSVVEPSSGSLNQGAVRVYGSVWTAFPADGEWPLKEGDAVTVERIEGNSIYVRRTQRLARPFTEISETE